MTDITDKVKEKVKDVKDKVIGSVDKATDTTKEKISSSSDTINSQGREFEEGAADRMADRGKDPTQEYDEKEPMSPAKIKEHEPTAVQRDPNDQRIVEGSQQEAVNTEDAKEKARRSGMTKGTAGA
jgi:hypothetical protein